MNTQQELKQKADTLLSLREDLYEMHFHQVDREWLIDAMLDFAAMNHMYFGEKSENPINLTSSKVTSENQTQLIIPSPVQISEDTSDGYHTFKELYEFRKVYNAALFNEWAKIKIGKIVDWGSEPATMKWLPKYDVHKSWKHNDGELCFGGGWFIVVAILPDGQISNHYKAEDWDLFQIPEVEKAKYEFDGHTSADTIKRINGIYTKKN